MPTTTMTPELAQRILDAFGPNSSTCECLTAADMVRDYEEGQYDGTPWNDVAHYVNMVLQSEDLWWSRAAENAYEAPTTAQTAHRENFRRGYHARVRLLLNTL